MTGSTANGGGPGDIAYNWQTNATNPLFSDVSPACGNNVLLNSGITATQCAITGVNPNLRSPYVTTWTLVLEHAITNNLGLEVAYVGNHGTKLISLTDVNEPPIGAGWTTGTKAACLSASECSGRLRQLLAQLSSRTSRPALQRKVSVPELHRHTGKRRYLEL